LRRSALGMTGIAALTDGSEAPLQGSFRSAPGFLPVVSTPSCQRLCSLQTTCPEYKRGRMSREKLSPLRPIAVVVLVVGNSFQTLSSVRAAELYTSQQHGQPRLSIIEGVPILACRLDNPAAGKHDPNRTLLAWPGSSGCPLHYPLNALSEACLGRYDACLDY